MSKLPYWIYPSFWGLKGKAKQKQIAEYYLEGFELDKTLLDIDYEPDTTEYKEKNLAILKKYNKINDIEFDIKMLEIRHFNKETNEYKKEHLAILKKYNQIDDYEFDIQMLKLEYINHELKDYKSGELAICKTHNKITDQEYDFAMLELLDHNSDEYKRGVVDTELKYNCITEREYKKAILTLDGEEYFEIIKGEYNTEESGILFEFDWNHIFVENLLKNGYKGETASDVVNEWFNDVARQIYFESIGEENLESTEGISVSNGNSFTKRNPLEEGFAEYN